MMQGTPPALTQARNKLEQVKRELSIQAEVCERHEKALQQLKKSGGSPAQIAAAKKALKRQINLYMQRMEQIGRPAAKAYAEALRTPAVSQAMPLDALLKEFVGLFSQSQASGLTSAMGTQAEINQFVDRMCKRAMAEAASQQSRKGYVTLQNAHLMAEALGAEDVPGHKKIVEFFNESAREHQGL